MTKHILKKAMRGPVCDEILDRRKQGFGVPVARWTKEDLLPALREQLSPDKLKREGFLRPQEVARLLDEHVTGRATTASSCGRLFMSETWVGAYGQPA